MVENYQREYQRRVRLEVIEMLGGKCAQCGENDPIVLQVDHINGGGTQERKTKGNSPITLRKEIRENPGTHQLLCANCNWRKRILKQEDGRVRPEMDSLIGTKTTTFNPTFINETADMKEVGLSQEQIDAVVSIFASRGWK